ncbi:MAG: hypothetical protein ACOCWA_01605 [Bacteroidota bacterium]
MNLDQEFMIDLQDAFDYMNAKNHRDPSVIFQDQFDYMIFASKIIFNFIITIYLLFRSSQFIDFNMSESGQSCIKYGQFVFVF